MSSPGFPRPAIQYKTIDTRPMPPARQQDFEEVWVTIIEKDDTEVSYHLPRKLADLI